METNSVMMAMIEYYQGQPRQIQHFIKVHSFASMIGIDEGLPAKLQEILEVAAIVHDIGIKPAWQKYDSSAGKYQEELGPDEANKMLKKLGYDDALIERVCYLIGHHHTYDNIDGLDYQILVEADFLVNLDENDSSQEAIKSAYQKIFKTKLGKRICETMFLKD